MSLKVHEVRLARIQLRKSTDKRPCVIVEDPRAGRVKVLPMSASDLFDPYKHFLISQTSADFAATGLPKESYVLDTVADINVEDVGRRLGELRGELLDDFKRWSGC